MKTDLRDHQPRKLAERKLGAKGEAAWEKQEKRLASIAGGRRQPRSGAGTFEKGDVKTTRELVEAKSTDKMSISITVEMLRKLCDQARGMGKKPALGITFGDTPPGVERDWVLVPASDYFEPT